MAMYALRNAAVSVKGYFDYTASAFVKKQARFIQADTEVDLKNEFIMITGGTSAIGKEAAIEMAKRGATIYLVCRNKELGEITRLDIIASSENKNIELFLCDFSSPKETLKFAKSFRQSKKRLTILCANHSALLKDFILIDGKYEATFAINTLSTHILVRELAPLLLEGANPKVFITTSSAGLAASLDKEGQNITVKPTNFDSQSVFGQVKKQNIEMPQHYGKNYPQIFFASWHPGYVDTPTLENSQPDFYKELEKKLRTPAQGADTLLWLVCLKNPLQRFHNGELFFDRDVAAKHLKFSDTEVGEAYLNKFMINLDAFYDVEKNFLNKA